MWNPYPMRERCKAMLDQLIENAQIAARPAHPAAPVASFATLYDLDRWTRWRAAFNAKPRYTWVARFGRWRKASDGAALPGTHPQWLRVAGENL